MTDLNDLQQNWNALGEQDPLWAILSFPDKRGGAWDLEEFFAMGRAEVGALLQRLVEQGIAIERGRALDFGCGVGRLTQALAEQFDSCDGVDVAPSMIKRARELNEQGDRVRFHVNDAPDLRLFADESFDFILSLIVFQHMKPELMRGYMREFVRVLRPGGVAVFNVPESFPESFAEELPPDACRASLTLIGTVPPIAPSRAAGLRAKVRNESPVPWPAAAQVRVGYRWRGPNGRQLGQDDVPIEIESTLDPGGECEVELYVFAPDQPGECELEIDLVQPGTGWFASQGSNTLRLPVTVVAQSDGPAAGGAAASQSETNQNAPAGFTPSFEMHAMAREDVVATVEEAGGVVLDVIEAWRRGPAVPTIAYEIARPVASVPKLSRGEPSRATVDARIRRVLEDSGYTARARQLLASGPEASERRVRALRLMEERADLVGFGLSSTLKGAGGRASTALRGALRRVLFQVLHRQTEHNRASDQLVRSHEAQLDVLGATIAAQLDIQAATDERLEALERRLARAEVTSGTLARQSAARAAASDVELQDDVQSTRK